MTLFYVLQGITWTLADSQTYWEAYPDSRDDIANNTMSNGLTGSFNMQVPIAAMEILVYLGGPCAGQSCINWMEQV